MDPATTRRVTKRGGQACEAKAMQNKERKLVILREVPETLVILCTVSKTLVILREVAESIAYITLPHGPCDFAQGDTRNRHVERYAVAVSPP